MNSLISRSEVDSEKFLHNLALTDIDVQKNIISSMDIDYHDGIKFSKCGPYLNRIIPDLKITSGDEILALIEVKGPKINVTDFVRGIGQLFQYEYFSEIGRIEKNNQKLRYSDNFETIYLYPSQVLVINDFDITKFKYPKSTRQLQINHKNYVVRNFSSEQQNQFSRINENLIAISEYYFRDIRLYELYILLNHLNKFHKNNSKINRTLIEKEELRDYKTANNHNWRNVFITLSGLGFIDGNNKVNSSGKMMLQKNYHEFCFHVYYEYIEPYVREILPIIIDEPAVKLTKLSNKIKMNNDNKDVLFVTESENRYLSSWLAIFRDDYGFINYQPHNTNRSVNYIPFDLSKNGLYEMICKYSNPHPAIHDFK